jgi:hypothetical protein
MSTEHAPFPPHGEVQEGAIAPKTTGKGRRRTKLEGAAVAAGLAWATARADQLRSEGRRILGGWPGTVSEARGCFVAHVMTKMGPGMVLAKAEIDELARATYCAARRDWVSKAGRDAEPGRRV